MGLFKEAGWNSPHLKELFEPDIVSNALKKLTELLGYLPSVLH